MKRSVLALFLSAVLTTSPAFAVPVVDIVFDNDGFGGALNTATITLSGSTTATSVIAAGGSLLFTLNNLSGDPIDHATDKTAEVRVFPIVDPLSPNTASIRIGGGAAAPTYAVTSYLFDDDTANSTGIVGPNRDDFKIRIGSMTAIALGAPITFQGSSRITVSNPISLSLGNFTASSGLAARDTLAQTQVGTWSGSGAQFNVSIAPLAAVPLPASLPALAGGLALLGWAARRRRRG
jgi:hypothetical protein